MGFPELPVSAREELHGWKAAGRLPGCVSNTYKYKIREVGCEGTQAKGKVVDAFGRV